MTRKEAIEELERLLSHWDDLENGKRSFRWYSKDAVEVAISALRPVSREQIEKVWRGRWQRGTKDWVCSRCGRSHTFVKSFCPNCGAPMTDEAMQISLKRLEELKDETD